MKDSKNGNWFERHKALTIVGAIVLAFMFLVTMASLSEQQELTQTTTDAALEETYESTNETEPTPKPEPKFEPVELSGDGSQLTEGFDLPGGGYRVSSTYNGAQTNFSAWLVDEVGEETDLVANEVGSSADVSTVISVSAGKYFFDVEAGGNWTIKVERL